MLSHIDHVFTQLVFCLVDTRCIKENDLSPVISVNGLNPVSGSLGLVRGDRDLLTDQMVHQCGLANIWASDQCYKS